MITLKEKLAYDYKEQRIIATRSKTSIINRQQAEERAKSLSDQFRKLTGQNVNDYLQDN